MKEDDLSKKERKEVIKEINLRLKEKVSNHASELRREFNKQVSTAIIAAFGLIIALAWKDVITDFLSRIEFVKEYGLLISALVLTLVSVIGILLMSKWSKNEENK